MVEQAESSGHLYKYNHMPNGFIWNQRQGIGGNL